MLEDRCGYKDIKHMVEHHAVTFFKWVEFNPAIWRRIFAAASLSTTPHNLYEHEKTAKWACDRADALMSALAKRGDSGFKCD